MCTIILWKECRQYNQSCNSISHRTITINSALTKWRVIASNFKLLELRLKVEFVLWHVNSTRGFCRNARSTNTVELLLPGANKMLSK